MKHQSKITILLLFIILLNSCNSPSTQEAPAKNTSPQKEKPLFTAYSNLKNTYTGFNSPQAINWIADIENEYFKDSEKGYSKYYGTVWAEHYDTEDYFELMNKKGIKADSMHCTIYAVEALEAGLGEGFERLESFHKKAWGKREHAGWSIGHILTTYFGWKAYLFISKKSLEYEQCRKSFLKHKKYPVWKQPDIPLEEMLILGEDDDKIDSLLNQNEFGWGFSQQGIHTWITRFNTLKECYWAGAPSTFDIGYDGRPLFIKTPFADSIDYDSHVVAFPPQIKGR